ncbi:MAG: hypothetical protein L6R41_008028 [Letrouitia leprolyta]|nr:MAG: hypothetical protein L6R41_008028 [Letrouitia leprolyta]
MKSFIISAIIGFTTVSFQGVNTAALPKVDVDVKRAPQEHCWEAPDGQVHCGWIKRSPQEHCWELPDGQVQCGPVKRDPQEHCWEAPDGQIHCSIGKRDALPDTEEAEKKPHHANPHYPDCGAPICPKSFIKRQEHCWEAPDGQIHCAKLMEMKRDASPEPLTTSDEAATVNEVCHTLLHPLDVIHTDSSYVQPRDLDQVNKE